MKYELKFWFKEAIDQSSNHRKKIVTWGQTIINRFFPAIVCVLDSNLNLTLLFISCTVECFTCNNIETDVSKWTDIEKKIFIWRYGNLRTWECLIYCPTLCFHRRIFLARLPQCCIMQNNITLLSSKKHTLICYYKLMLSWIDMVPIVLRLWYRSEILCSRF